MLLSTFYFLIIISSYVGGYFAGIFVYTTYMACAHEGQKRESDILEPELQTAVNCHVGIRNGTCVLWKSIQGS